MIVSLARQPKTLVALAAVCVAVLTSCTQTCGTLVPDTPLTNAALIDRSLMTDDECVAPCWNGIAPGQSSDADAMATLGNLESIEQDSIARAPDDAVPAQADYIRWQSAISRGSPPIGSIRVSDEGHVIEIRSTLEYELPVSKLIDRYGEPDHFSVRQTAPQCYFAKLFWLETGLAADLYRVSETGTDSPLATPETLVYRVYYFEPVESVSEYWQGATLMPHQEANQMPSAPWEGYDSVRVSALWPAD